MADRPILFSAPMVLALLAGTKTQTRRALAPDLFISSSGAVVRMKSASVAGVTGISEAHCPYWREPGDRLWVRETWQAVSGTERARRIVENPRPSFGWVEYSAGPHQAGDEMPPRWRPSIHMPRWASRITLEVTGVRVERLQDISRGDAMAEGCPFANMAAGPDPRDWYRDLWNEINGAGAWDANPWVWCVSFKSVEASHG
jgi:hypothetical protein